jgi:hypothetical protein
VNAKIAATLGTLALAQPANAMSYSYRLYGNNQFIIEAAGEIMPDERTRYGDWLRRLPPEVSNRFIAAIIFSSSGGSTLGALDMAQVLMQTTLDTGVAQGGECTSACVILWATGVGKSVAPDARIGVHQMEADGHPLEQSSRALADGLTSLGAPSSVADAAATTPPTSMYWLTPADLAAWKVKVIH